MQKANRKNNVNKFRHFMAVLAIAVLCTSQVQAQREYGFFHMKVMRIKDLITGKYLAFDYTKANTRLVEKIEDEAGGNCLFRIISRRDESGLEFSYIQSLTNDKIWNLYSNSFEHGGYIGSYDLVSNNSIDLRNQDWLLTKNSDGKIDITSHQDYMRHLDYDAANDKIYMRALPSGTVLNRFAYEIVDMESVSSSKAWRFINKANKVPLALLYDNNSDDDNYAVTKPTANAAYTDIWHFERDGNAGYRIINTRTQKALTLKSGNGFEDGNLLNQWAFVNGANQYWLVWKDSHGELRIASKVTGKFVAAYNGGGTQQVVQWSSAADNSRWALQDVSTYTGDLSGKVVRFKHVTTGKYLALNYTSGNSELVLRDENSAGANLLFLLTPNKTFTADAGPTGYYLNSLTSDHKVIDVSSLLGTIAVGSRPINSPGTYTERWTLTLNQQWTFTGYKHNNGNKLFTIIGLNTSDKALGIAGTGDNIINKARNESDFWTIEEVDMSTLPVDNVTFTSKSNGNLLTLQPLPEHTYGSLLYSMPATALGGRYNKWFPTKGEGKWGQLSYSLRNTDMCCSSNLFSYAVPFATPVTNGISGGAGLNYMSYWYIWKDSKGYYRIASQYTGRFIVGTGTNPSALQVMETNGGQTDAELQWSVASAGPASTARIAPEGANAVTLYPNPVTDQFTIQLSHGSEAAGTVVIRDITGAIVVSLPVSLHEGENKLFVPCTQLVGHAGIYLVDLIDAQQEHLLTQKITVQ